jgi:hypothetical protein
MQFPELPLYRLQAGYRVRGIEGQDHGVAVVFLFKE